MTRQKFRTTRVIDTLWNKCSYWFDHEDHFLFFCRLVFYRHDDLPLVGGRDVFNTQANNRVVDRLLALDRKPSLALYKFICKSEGVTAQMDIARKCLSLNRGTIYPYPYPISK